MKLLSVVSFFLFNLLSAFADPALPAGSTTTTAAGPAATPGMGSMLVPFIAMFGVMYFLMIRPQQKRAKEQATMLSSLKAGDEVLTTSGILGKVKDINERVVTVEVDKNVSIKFLKTQVSQIIPETLPGNTAATV